MAVKLLLSGLSNAGKTTLLASLEDAFVISHDGKNFPFPIPHTNVAEFNSSGELIKLITEKVQLYKSRNNKLPATVAIDSVSKIFDTLYDICNVKHSGFKIYSELNKEIHEFTDYIQNVLIENGINVVLLSHATYDGETSQYNLVGKGEYCLAA